MVGTADLRQLLTATTAAGPRPSWSATPISWRRSRPAAACSPNSATDLPWTQHLSEVWRMRDPDERAASLALRDGARQPAAQRGRLVPHPRPAALPGIQIAMAADALDGLPQPTAPPARTRCWSATPPRWPTRSTGACTTTPSPPTRPTVTAARDQRIARRRPILSRRNDPTIARATRRRRTDRRAVDPVRNGNRWRVAAIDPTTNRIAAERLTDGARAVFDGDYVREHVTLGYATTVHSAQGVTADTTHAVLGDSATRVHGLRRHDPRPRRQHRLPLHPRSPAKPTTNTAPVAGDEIHQLRRGNKYAAAHTSGRSWPTTTGPAPCTPKPNTPTASCFPASSPGCWTVTTPAAPHAKRVAGAHSRSTRFRRCS